MSDNINVTENALVALQAGRWDEAESFARQSIKRSPNNVTGYLILAVCETQNGNCDEAHRVIDKALGINPNIAECHNQKAITLNKQKRFGEAVASLREAIRLQPTCPYFHMNLAGNLKPLGRLPEALMALEDALAAGEDPHILTRLAGGYLNLQEFDKAEDYFKRSLALAPNLALTHHEMCYLHFYRGEWAEAWPRFELRLEVFKDLNFYIQQFGLEMHWRKGEDLTGRSLLIHTEQGNGDTIQFMRYIPLIKKRHPNCTVTFLVYDSLEGIAKNYDLGIDSLVVFYPGDQAMVPTFDRYTSLMSLPHLLDVSHPIYPLQPKTRTKRTFRSSSDFNVVICNSGNSEHENDQWRSCHMKYFSKLAEIPNVRLYSLTKPSGPRVWGETEVDLHEGVDFPITDLSHTVKTFADSAEYIQGADLVISVDTSVLHLAGSLGVETWGVLPFYGEWRWGTVPDKTVWYPSVQLFRQTSAGDWDGVFERMADSLWDRVEAQQKKLSA